MPRVNRLLGSGLRSLSHITRSIAFISFGMGLSSVATAGYQFSEILVAGSNDVQGFGIQGNLVTGFYADAAGNFHGFVDQGGVVSTVNAPTAQPGLSQTNLNHLNAAGTVAVNYVDNSGVSQSALYNVLTKNWTLLPAVSGSQGSGANGVNSAGTVVGSYTTDPMGATNYHGFTLTGSTYSTFDVPSANFANQVGTAAYDINNAGQVVGYYTDAAGNYHGFIKNGTTYQTIDLGGVGLTQVLGENNKGQVVGTYFDASGNEHGFLMTGSNVTTIDYPGVSGTAIDGIDDAGNLTGYFLDASGNYHGFIAFSVPEPGSITLLGIGCLSLLVAARKSRLARVNFRRMFNEAGC